MLFNNALIFNKNEVWVKKDNPDFDAAVSRFHGVEVCELADLYLLDILRKEFGDNKTGLYREDGLCCFHNLCGLESETMKENFSISLSNMG